ncbi:hypothetical protein [Paractinoplanes maris]|uniref:hypothetical protein n=1 Tax=Paractinoplanes maris TaxID=1734446 RepID=UPI0020210EC0|nr:hypothetical protein [Actinoplanes maris]
MIELTELRVFSEMENDFLGRSQGLLLIGPDQDTTEVFYGTPWTSEEEAQRLLNARYAALVSGSSRPGSDRVEGMTEFDNLRTLCAERNAILDERAENEAYPNLVGDEDVLLEEAFGDTHIHLLTTLIERSRQRLFTIADSA